MRYAPVAMSFVLAALLLSGCGDKPKQAVQTPAPKPAPAASPALAGPPADYVETPPPTNTKCPVSGEDIDPKDRKLIIADYNGKAYGLCCRDCLNEFSKHPEKYAR